MPARNVVLDPIVGTEIVEVVSGLGIVVVGRQISDRLVLRSQNRGDMPRIVRQFGLGIVAAEKIIRILGRIRLRGVHIRQREAKTRRQTAHGDVHGVDEFTTPFAGLAVSPEGVVGVHAPADSARSLIHRARHARILQSQCGHQSGDSGADNPDARGRGPDERGRP